MKMRLRPAFFAAILAGAVLSACAATPESQVRSGLMNAGLSRPMANCMAQRMVDRLSLMQLRRLSSLSSLKGQQIGQLTIAEFLHKARALGDPKILEVVTTAGLGCAIAT